MRVKAHGLGYFAIFPVLALACVAFLHGSDAYGDENEKKKDLPPRAISVALDYTGVVVKAGEDVSVDLQVTNGGRQDEDIELLIPSIPEGWRAWIKTYNFKVTGVHVESDKSKNLTLKAEAEKGVKPGNYVIPVKGQTRDGKLTSMSQVVITVKGEEEKEKSKDVSITTSYPVLQGANDAKFEFSLEVTNKLDKDTIYNLSAEGPKNWSIRFKPAYEEKYFSSLRIKSDRSENMAVEVKPNPQSEAGTYPIKVRVASEDAKTEAELTVVLTGTYKLEAGTPAGLLSLAAFQGQVSNFSFYVKNAGSAIQNNVKFLSFKPENWKVEFKPEKIDTITPGEVKQMEINITPADQALVGDYSVSVSAEGQKASKEMELRVTVRASTAWGWIGIGIIVLVMVGLITLFVRMGRR